MEIIKYSGDSRNELEFLYFTISINIMALREGTCDLAIGANARLKEATDL